jgi:FMN phosphatase YigB (HAD superfamily)
MQNQFFANDLNDQWIDNFKDIKILSLDCFDTIVWRKVVEPTDVFFNLQNSELFRELGITATVRGRAESAARRKKNIGQGSTEVSFKEIYREILPHADDALLAGLIDEEIACELRHSFIFEPVARLIRQARLKGLKIVVVSDTYFSEPQLKRLLFTLMPDLEDMIDHVFCSSTIGLSKAGGNWKTIIARLNVLPKEICHLGDNKVADVEAPSRFGITASLLRHQCPLIADLLRQRTDVGLQLLPHLRYRNAAPSYFHAQFAAKGEDLADPVRQIGYAVLGPILYAFAHFIRDEVRQLESAGVPVKIAFLLRDGYMPSRAYSTMTRGEVGAEINISRFASIAASLNSREAVIEVLANSLTPDSIPALLKQFLIPSHQARKILGRVQNSAYPESEFVRFILRDETLKGIFANSRAYRARLMAHIRKRTGVQPGETLMFIDLGYSGTAQTRLKSVLKSEMNVDLIGRYLISSKVAADQTDRKGLIDPSSVDERLVLTLTAYIAAFEMMCTQDLPSTENFTIDGEPVFAHETTKANQASIVSDIQKACLQFVADFIETPQSCRPSLNMSEMADLAAIELARLIYFPLPEEIDCLRHFEFDFNLGTDLKFSIADLDAGLIGMRREGLGFMNKEFRSIRMNYPIELRHIDVSLSTLLLSIQRYGWSVTPARASFRKETLPAIIANHQKHTTSTVDAYATHDGYFCLNVPASSSFDISVLLGQHYECIQFDCLQKVCLNDTRIKSELRIGEEAVFDGIISVEHDLIKLENHGMLYFPALKSDEPGYMRRLIFRPILRRGGA